MRITIPEWPWNVVCRLAEEQATRIWLVGGAVRDVLLGRPIHDWDFLVEREALKLARNAADILGGVYYPLDAEHEIGRVLLMEHGRGRVVLDFATLREPDLESDLRIRDFTINAMAADQSGVVSDPTGGLADLQARLVRVAGRRSFADDPIRLLRAVRMEAELGFEIEPGTAELLRQSAGLLFLSSAERLRDEFVRILALPGSYASLHRLDEFELLARVIPELETLKGVTQSLPHRFDVWTHTLLVLDTLETLLAVLTGEPQAGDERAGVPRFAWGELERVLGQFARELSTHLTPEVTPGRDRAVLLKLGALLHDLGKPSTRSQGEDGRVHFYEHELVGAKLARERLRELRFSRDEIARVELLIAHHMYPAHLAQTDKLTRRAIYRYFRATGDAGVETVLLSLADHLATWGPYLQPERWTRRLEVAEALLTGYFEQRSETLTPLPLITGEDLMTRLGLVPGPEVGELLEAVREAQAAGEVSTKDEALALAARLHSSS
ncbi:MAG: HD domain-containing protein [Anaerolineae bacterium]|nr:HD domain-containing protein [Anaerolineae bacterium]